LRENVERRFRYQDPGLCKKISIGNKMPRRFGAIHKYATFLPEEPTLVNGKMIKQTLIDEVERKRKRELVHEWVSLWACEAVVHSIA